MAKLTRKTAKIFASSAASNDIEQFGSKEQTGTANYTSDPAVIQELAAWGVGWTDALVGANNSEYKQDRNAVDFVASYQIAYLLQMGVPEWDSGTTYYTNSFCSYNGSIYQSLADDNTNNTPPNSGSTSYWKQYLGNIPEPTQTVLTSGSGTYTIPSGCIRIFIRMIGGGGGGGGTSTDGSNGGDTTFGIYTAYHGNGGQSASGGSGGASSFGSFNVAGGAGGDAYIGYGALGGSGFYGGAGKQGTSAATNSGAGGGGNTGGGGGGGAGGYGELQINSPVTSYSYSVGTSGSGASGAGNGGSGVIIIEEFYY